MSSQQGNARDQKRRKIQRACDMCRLKKARCDGLMSRRACTNCVTNQYDCTYIQMKKPVPDKAYVESLEARLAKMESVLRKICPDPNLRRELQLSDLPSPDTSAPTSPGNTLSVGPCTPTSSMNQARTTVDVDDLDSSDDDESNARKTLEQCLGKLSLDPGKPHFFGKSSSFMLFQTAMDAKDEYANIKSSFSSQRQGEAFKLPFEGSNFLSSRSSPPDPPNWRQEFSFPDPDLMFSLINTYFPNQNVNIPLLHRPTFQTAVMDGLHLRDDGFGCTVLLVCALGARFFDDPRVFPKGSCDNPYLAGWQWFRQIKPIFQVINLEAPRLYDIQIACLAAMYLSGTSSATSAWPVVGHGIRLAQSLGAHRRKVYCPGPTVETESMKRAFWILIYLDRSMSSAMGRPCSMQEEDFDLDLPIECDDEYWLNSEDPKLDFIQPLGKPSKISHFNCIIRLSQIHAFALRTIYAINKSKAQLGFIGTQWQEKIVAELDSSLNQWMDSIPDHLKWDPQREDLTFLSQSASLYAAYYTLQIIVHRPFIPSPQKPSPCSFPSLAICTNAARSCIRVLDVQFQRALTFDPRRQIAPIAGLFSSGMVLLLNIWGAKRSGSSVDPATEMQEVHKAMRMLKALEPRFHTVARFREILYALAGAGGLPLPQTNCTHKPNSNSALLCKDPEVDSKLPNDWNLGTAGSSTSSFLDVPQEHLMIDQLQSSNIPANLAATSHPQSLLLVDHNGGPGRIPSTHAPSISFPSSGVQSERWDSFVPLSAPQAMSDNHHGAPYHAQSTSAGSFGHFDTYPPGQRFVDNVTLDMWSNAPPSFGWQDWDTYINTFELMSTNANP